MNASAFIAWLKLLRLPNIFTPAADVMMGYLVMHGMLRPGLHFGLLVAASCLLYLSGMVLNDVFDVDVDARERPDRPIPSGSVSLTTGKSIGWGMWLLGIAVACMASVISGDVRPGAIGLLLAVCIVLYDYTLKQTPLAPVAMGTCRMLNVLLGMSLGRAALAPGEISGLNGLSGWAAAHWLVAIGIGTYIAGVTWFARTEARTSSRLQLASATIVLLAGIGLIASLPTWRASDMPLVVASRGWCLLWLALALLIARRCVLAIIEPTPPRVQSAVRNCVQSLIVLDAAITAGYVGIFWGCAILLLIFPTMLLTAWLNAT